MEGFPQRILLVGVGYVGQELAKRLVSRGHEVFGLRRSQRALPEGVIGLVGDVSRDDGLDRLPSAIDQIVYAVSPGERSELAYRSVYVEGLARVFDRIPNARMILVSSTAVYGEAVDEPITEATPPRPRDGPTRQLALAERVMAEGHSPGVVVRASGIYGPGRTRLLSRLARDTLSAAERSIITNRIHRDDLARCLAFLVEHPEARGVLNASDAEPSTLGSMADWVRGQGLPRAWLESQPLGTTTERPRKSRAISSAKLRASGFELSYPSFREGYGAVLEALRRSEPALKP